ncbi:hypothetical protein QQ008_03325 [Fulvivirgaceae bacterium BMA10]|uniref:Uncharacterized protein n=1 Tax=Splendidivirga corallicola TaxID=3051826 RepID=A0ABT8KIW2_9BACT|nr:hypothetical protein [Fulvivirgaceae bacterium BMA10]
MMPNSGGWTSSSLELMAHYGALIFRRFEDGLYKVIVLNGWVVSFAFL